MSDTSNSATHGMLNASLSFSATGNIMQYTTHATDASIQALFNGTCLQGTIDASYEDLVNMFGEPTKGDNYKVDAEWYVKFSDGTIASVYNWKDGKNYNGDEGTETEQIRDWHIGGFDKKAGEHVQIALDLYREKRDADPAKAKSKRQKFQESLESAFDMMDTIRSTKGVGYAHAVEIAMLTHKMLDLVQVLIIKLVDSDELPEESAKDMVKVFALITSRIIGLAARSSNEGKELDKAEAKELMAWAERIMEREKEGALGFLNDMLDKDD